MTDRTRWRREWGPLLLAWLLALPLFTPRLYAADEVKYFVHLRSVWFDGDVDYANEYARFIEIDPRAFGWLHELLDTPSPTGRRLNDAPIGAAVLWAPFYVAADGAVVAARALGADVARDGYSRPYQWAVCLASLFWGTLGLALTYRLARRLYPIGPSRAATLAIWFASPLVFYLYITPPMAHAPSVFAVALFLWCWLRDGVDAERGPAGWALLGAAAGLMVLVRELNWLLLIPLAVVEAWSVWKRVSFDGPATTLERVPGYAAFLAALAVVVAPQFATYQLLHGTYGPTPFVVQKFSAFPVHGLQVLFSGFHGLFSWHPVTLLAVVGLGFLARREPALAAGFALAFLAQVIVVGSYDTWWGGTGFGARRFLNFAPIFLIGLAALLDAVSLPRRRLAYAVVAALVLWNFGLALQYATGMIPRDRPVTMRTIVVNQVVEVPRAAGGVAWRFLTDRWSLVEHAPVESR